MGKYKRVFVVVIDSMGIGDGPDAADFDDVGSDTLGHISDALGGTFLIPNMAKLGIANYKDKQGMTRQKFLARLQGEITRRGVIDVLRHGIKHGALSFGLRIRCLG